MSELLIRKATDADISEIMEIEKSSFPDPWSESAFRVNLINENIFSVVCLDGRVVGYAIISVIPPEGELYNIAVASKLQGKGVSEQLFNETQSQAYERGVRTIYLEVRESNLRARSFYKKLGFSEIGIRKKYYHQPTENAVLMSKNIEINGKE